MTVQVLFLFSLVLALVLVWACSRYLLRHRSPKRRIRLTAGLTVVLLATTFTPVIWDVRGQQSEVLIQILFTYILMGGALSLFLVASIAVWAIAVAHRRGELGRIIKYAIVDSIYHVGVAIAGVFRLLGALAEGLGRHAGKTEFTGDGDTDPSWHNGSAYDTIDKWAEPGHVGYPVYLDMVEPHKDGDG